MKVACTYSVLTGPPCTGIDLGELVEAQQTLSHLILYTVVLPLPICYNYNIIYYTPGGRKYEPRNIIN